MRMSNLSAVSVASSGWRTAFRTASVGKYDFKARPLTVMSPLPGPRKKHPTQALRRPVPRYCTIAATLSNPLFQAQGNGLLRRMGVLFARVNLQLPIHLLAQLRLG